MTNTPAMKAVDEIEALIKQNRSMKLMTLIEEKNCIAAIIEKYQEPSVPVNELKVYRDYYLHLFHPVLLLLVNDLIRQAEQEKQP